MAEITADAIASAAAEPGRFDALAKQLRDPYFLAGTIIYIAFILIAIFADQIASDPPLEILFLPNGKLAAALPPSADHLLGTTTSGRDIFSQLVHGTRAALTVGISAAAIVALVGTAIGLLSGYFRGWVDAVLMRLADVALGLPLLPFVIVSTAFLGASTWNIVLGIAVLLWPNSARIIRSQVLTVRERAYIEAARVTGSSDLKIILLHIAPNVLPLSFLFGSIAIGWAILIEASVSFLGFGDPDRVSWGYMLQDAYISQSLSRGLFHWFVPPGICIILVVCAGFFISRSYEQLLFPKLRE